jgi:predicted nucleic-acid-binding Zn-ribbon protein
MNPQQKDRMINSIINQLQIKDVVIKDKMFKIVNEAILVNYDSLKLLAKNLKNILEIQHSKILNVIAKSLGYQNHHSMKASFDKLNSKDLKIQINENDSVLKKLFLIKDEFIKKFGIERTYILSVPSNKFEFNFVFNKKGLTLRSKEKIEINRYLDSYGIEVYKTYITISKISKDSLIKIAFNILNKYKSFFEPIWYENDDKLNNYIHLTKNWSMLSYTDIKIINNSLIVDGYSSDLADKVIINFLDYVFHFGTLKDIEFFENCLKQNTQSFSKNDINKLEDLARVYDWENQQILSSFIKSGTKDIGETLEDINYTISIMEYMRTPLKQIEITNNKTIKEIIIDNCVYFYNLGNKYNKNIIKEKLFIELLKKEKKDYFDIMEDIEDTDIYLTHHNICNSIEKITDEIFNLLNMYKDSKNI